MDRDSCGGADRDSWIRGWRQLRGTATPFYPRRATEEHGERQHHFVRGGRGFLDYWMGMILGTAFCRRTGIPGRGLMDRDSCGGADRDLWISGWRQLRGTATPFYPRRATEEHGERQHHFVRGGRGFLDYWMGMILGTAFCRRRARSRAYTFLSVEDGEGRTWNCGLGFVD